MCWMSGKEDVAIVGIRCRRLRRHVEVARSLHYLQLTILPISLSNLTITVSVLRLVCTIRSLVPLLTRI